MVNPISGNLINPFPASETNQLMPTSTSQNSDIFRNSDPADPLNGLNMDQWNIPFADKQKIQFARFLYGLNYQTFNSMSASQGQQVPAEGFTPQDTYNFLQNYFSKNPTFSPTTSTSPSSTSQQTGTSTSTTDVPSQTTSSTQNTLTQLQEYFSPENTAQRILDVATSFFNVSQIEQNQGNTEASRQNFANLIGTAIDEGFKQAGYKSNQWPDAVQSGVDKTHSLVSSGLDSFVKNGIDAQTANSVSPTEKIAAYRQEAALYFDQFKKAFEPGDYTAQGVIQAFSQDTYSKMG
ncbi:MAG: DUF5610 domain-containing protein [Candidatus Riflebacteria bacterium]|nr:DUF5610 domain-containing protein [Candidatus Riflebacteria bacterium]